ncbi:MAG: tetratricopeptide repeat protein [Planctomycetota bacterium]
MVIGEKLGVYRLVAELGSGAMGTVYRAEDEAGAVFALKVVHAHLLSTPEFRERSLREARIGQQIRHENVVATYGIETEETDGEETLYLSMEYVEGDTLRALLLDMDRVPEDLCRHIAFEIVKALEAIHDKDVVHRDLKPENVLITKDHVVKVMDLGVARRTEETLALSKTGAFVGSIPYGAPEQFLASEPDPRSDLYALGVMLYELSTGKHPFPGTDAGMVIQSHLNVEPRPVAEINPQLTPFFEELVKVLLAKSPDDRFASAAAVADVLERAETSEWWIERVRSMRAAAQKPLRRVRVPRETGIYGRDEPIARLRASFDRACDGDGRVVIVEGEAGIGKTRLVDEFVAQLRESNVDFNFLFGSYPPGGAATAAGAFSTAYLEEFGAGGLEESLEEYLAVTPSLVPAFAALLRGEPTPKGEEPLNKDSLHAVFVHATRALAAERPTIVLIDDLHFAPNGGRGLFAALALALPGHRIMLVGASRPGLPEDWVANVEHLPHGSRLQVPRLGPKDLAALLMDAFGSQRLAEELAYQIGIKSDGNPFFAFEIIRGLREGQFITQKPDGTWVRTQVIEQIQIPSSVLDLVQARMADLGEDERSLLEVASCCGYEFDPRLVGEVLEMARIPALQKLGRIEKSHRLIRSVGARYLFDHHQVQEALYEGLAAPLREAYHAALADAIESRDYLDRSEGVTAVMLCRHLFLGGRGASAGAYLDVALSHLEKGYLHEAFVELIDQALSTTGLLTGHARVEILLRARAMLDLLGLNVRERAVLDEAMALTADGCAEPDVGLRARVLHKMGEHLYRASEYEPADGRFREALDLAESVGDRGLAGQVIGALGAIAFDQARFEDARDLFASYRDISIETGDRMGESAACGNLGIALKNLGQVEDARLCGERQLAISKEIGNGRGEAIATGNVGLIYSLLGQKDQARAHFESCLELSRRIGFRRGEASATGNLGTVYQDAGEFEKACECHRSHRELSRETGDRRSEAISAGNLGLGLASLGRYADAVSELESFRDLSRAIGNRRGEGMALETLGGVLRELGDLDAARSDIDAALELARENGARVPESCALRTLGLVAEDAGDVAESVRLFREALALQREIDYRTGEVPTLVLLARAEAKAGEPDASKAHLDEALTLAREVMMPGTIVLAAAHAAMAAPETVDVALVALTDHADRSACGERMEARFCLFQATNDATHLAAAHKLLSDLRNHAPEKYRETMIENVPLHRAIKAAWERQRGQFGSAETRILS